MDILWVAEKYLDVSIDHATWTEMTKNLEKRGHRVFLVAGRQGSQKPDFGLLHPIHYIPSLHMKLLDLFFFHFRLSVFLFAFLVTHKPDVVFFSPFSYFTMIPFVLLRKTGLITARFILDVRTLPVRDKGPASKIMNYIFGISLRMSKYFYDGMTVITPFMRQVLCEQYRLHPNKIGIWTSGVTISVFSPQRVNLRIKDRLRKEFKLKDKFVVMYHGVLPSNRGLQETILAIKSASKRIPNVTLLLVGQGQAKPLLEEMILEHQLAGKVIIIGPVPYEHIPEYINLSDVGILPFPPFLWWRVSSPIKLMEYLAMSKPVIVTDIEAHRDVLKSCPSALFIDSNRPEDIVQGIQTAYRCRHALMRLGRKGMELVQKYYTWEAQSEHLEKYFYTVMRNAF